MQKRARTDFRIRKASRCSPWPPANVMTSPQLLPTHSGLARLKPSKLQSGAFNTVRIIYAGSASVLGTLARDVHALRPTLIFRLSSRLGHTMLSNQYLSMNYYINAGVTQMTQGLVGDAVNVSRMHRTSPVTSH